ncbi:unnamed protein product [Urochloa humidicola]
MARWRVNAFVSDATKWLIRDVLTPGSVDSSTVLVLANALYFKGTCARPFDPPSRTFAAPFHHAGGDVVRAPFMTASLLKEQLVAVFPQLQGAQAGIEERSRARCVLHALLLLPNGEALKIGHLYGRLDAGVHREPHAGGRGRCGLWGGSWCQSSSSLSSSRRRRVRRSWGSKGFWRWRLLRHGGRWNGLFISGVYHKRPLKWTSWEPWLLHAATAVVIDQGRPPAGGFRGGPAVLVPIVEERSGVVLFLGHVANPLAE